MRIRNPADLARLVKTRRQAQGRSQQDVADAAGITRQSLARIERGHGGVSFDTLLILLNDLGIHLDGKAPEEADADVPASEAAHRTQGIPSALFTQAALRQLQPSIDALAASATESTRSSIAETDLTAPLRESLSALVDAASRAQLRSAIEAGDPATRGVGKKPAVPSPGAEGASQ